MKHYTIIVYRNGKIERHNGVTRDIKTFTECKSVIDLYKGYAYKRKLMRERESVQPKPYLLFAYRER